MRKQKVELVKCITQNIEVPADADIIIEGYVDPEEDFIWEGPFGDHTGFYSLADWYPKFHVTCITRRKDAVYPATIVWVPPMEDAWIGKATERIFLAPIRLAMLPEVIDYDLPFEGVAHNITVVKINKTYPGQALKVMNALWGAGQMMFNKIMIVVDQDIDIHDYDELAKTIYNNLNPESDIHFSTGPLDVLDHSSTKYTFGSKLGIDATVKFIEEKEELSLIEIVEPEEIYIDELKATPEIFNIKLLKKYGILIVSIKKESKQQIEKMAELLYQQEITSSVKIVIFVDQEIDVEDKSMIAWISSGNIDPKRDSIILKGSKKTYSKIFIDATQKSFKRDGFRRDWPNIVVSDEETIKKIDQKWNSLGLGEFISSPSLKYRKLNRNKGAIAKD